MANTYTLIASNTLSTSAASIDFTSIPSTYSDLSLRFSARTNVAAVPKSFYIKFNSISTSTHSVTYLTGNGATASSSRQSNSSNGIFAIYSSNGDSSTSNTFTNVEIYIPAYASSNNKCLSIDSGLETNATTAYIAAIAGLWRNTAAISSISLLGGGEDFMSGSSFYLYGIKNT